ncbi:MAG: 7,8-didemethyl-8-hydroxy-5-deazariboflavin synthase CofG [Myxococcota bacterium]
MKGAAAKVDHVNQPPENQPPALREIERWLHAAVDDDRLEGALAARIGAALDRPGVLDAVVVAADAVRKKGHSTRVTVARNIFIPLTNLCRDRCDYCTFAKPPDSPEAKTYEIAEVREAVRGGVATGCTEALFCLGDKPEVAYRGHRAWLAERGWDSTVAQLVEACQAAFEDGMLPHTNAGILSQEEMAELRPWNASMGLMLETTSTRLRQKGMPHYYAPDKEPEKRLRMHAEAGELKIPFTSGILLGIGENDAERADTLVAIRELQLRFGHIQEVIVQPFHPKPSTRMRAFPSLRDEIVLGWVALARLVLGSRMNLQAPPNLAPGMLERLLAAGVNDWGGVSPVSIDFINPEAPWPQLRELRQRTRAADRVLRERLPVHPEYILDRPDFFDPQMREALARFATDEGLARVSDHQSHYQSDEEAA